MSNALPNHHDAELVLKLYDLRRESVMREARNWMATFAPKSMDDVMAVVGNFTTKENAYFRQVCSYWEMVAALIAHGTLNADLAFDTLGEMYFVYAIIEPFLEDMRKRFNSPDVFAMVQKVVESNPKGRERVKQVQARRAEFMKMMASAAKSGD